MASTEEDKARHLRDFVEEKCLQLVMEGKSDVAIVGSLRDIFRRYQLKDQNLFMKYLLYCSFVKSDITLWTPLRPKHFWDCVSQEVKEATCKEEPMYTLPEITSYLSGESARLRFPKKFPIHTLNLMIDLKRPQLVKKKNTVKSRLQHLHRLKMKHPVKFDKRLKKYMKYIIKEEYEFNNGLVEDIEYRVSMVGSTCWTPIEKERFFIGLERCGKYDISGICRHIGMTKTVFEVGEYLQMLDMAAKELPPSEDDIEEAKLHSAREMSDLFVMQESHLGTLLEQRLELDAYEKNEITKRYQDKAQNLIMVNNLSYLSRLFSNRPDMTILPDILPILYLLLKQFVKDILSSLNTSLLNTTDKYISVSRMNFEIVKRRKLWRPLFSDKPDVRLSQLDIRNIFDKHFTSLEDICDPTPTFLLKLRRTIGHHTYAPNPTDEEIAYLRIYDKELREVVDKELTKEESTINDDDMLYGQYYMPMPKVTIDNDEMDYMNEEVVDYQHRHKQDSLSDKKIKYGNKMETDTMNKNNKHTMNKVKIEMETDTVERVETDTVETDTVETDTVETDTVEKVEKERKVKSRNLIVNKLHAINSAGKRRGRPPKKKKEKDDLVGDVYEYYPRKIVASDVIEKETTIALQSPHHEYSDHVVVDENTEEWSDDEYRQVMMEEKELEEVYKDLDQEYERRECKKLGFFYGSSLT